MKKEGNKKNIKLHSGNPRRMTIAITDLQYGAIYFIPWQVYRYL